MRCCLKKMYIIRLFANAITDKIRKGTAPMNITDIKIRKVMQEGRLKAIVSITLDNSIAVHDIRLVEGEDRMFVAMPSRRDEQGRFRDIIHPISPDVRNLIEERIIGAYSNYEP